ncbi:MAG: hypothetical protein HQ518_17405 [Rhodopirellula sp.]|nr:hypothetical protein [Rhodopirellula sp.]
MPLQVMPQVTEFDPKLPVERENSAVALKNSGRRHWLHVRAFGRQKTVEHPPQAANEQAMASLSRECSPLWAMTLNHGDLMTWHTSCDMTLSDLALLETGCAPAAKAVLI